MRIHLPRNNFSFFKIISGTLFLFLAASFPLLAGLSFLGALAVGRAHSLGAWLGMWRAGKFTPKYIVWMILLTLVVSFWGFTLVSFTVLSFVTFVLFTLHFIFDEFELQEEKRSFVNILSSLNPTILVLLFLVTDFLKLWHLVGFSFFISLALMLLAVEMINLKEINWFFVQTKVLTLYILYAIFAGISSSAVLGVFLMFHYFFWFIYPVYKLHKYKREERDGFIMILLILVSSSVYFAVTRFSYVDEVFNLVVKAFLVGTIIHVLSTAPFAYLFGLPKSKSYL